MTTWRDAVSPQVAEQLDDLLDQVLAAAKEQLRVEGVLGPISLVLDDDGRVSRRTVEIGDAESGEEVLSAYSAEVAQIEALRAVAIAFDSDLEGRDAIQVLLEHRDPAAPALVLALPYRRRRSDGGGGLSWGQLRAAPGQRRVWL